MPPPPTSTTRVFFPGLDELRGIAALSVMVHHIELYKHRDGSPSLYQTKLSQFVGQLGHNGVLTFFVLSGFLITYLLLSEKSQTGTINLGKFYMRRTLRIWPLYYLIVLISFVLLPSLAHQCTWLSGERHYKMLINDLVDNPLPRLLLFLCFLPNVALRLAKPVVGGSQAWSVGVEEQFYLAWPVLLKFFPKTRILFVFVSVAIFYPVSPFLATLISTELADMLDYLVRLLPIHLMSLGAIGAYLVFYSSKQIQPFAQNRALFLLNTLLLVFLLTQKIHSLFLGVIVMFEILYLVQHCFSWNLRSRPLASIGTISYGVYMLHPTIMFLAFGLLNSLWGFAAKSLLYQGLAYVLVVGGTLFISYLSYLLLERPFINLKNRYFTMIPSGRSHN
jgi:peptidoglycan/LPS O-acetylase OafA/YrhL